MTITKITISMVDFLKGLKENDGATFKDGDIVEYKTGYQVATLGYIFKTAEARAKAIEKMKTCGVWFSGGVYYVDESYWVKTKKVALAIGDEYAQQSILKWADKSLVWL